MATKQKASALHSQLAPNMRLHGELAERKLRRQGQMRRERERE